MGMFVRALSYILSHGADGLKQASEDAVLNANYVRARLADLMSLPFGNRPCMHEVLFDDAWLKDTGVTTLDFAKAMIDEGYHPMTMYFPLVVHGAMLIEPTETESKFALDEFIRVMKGLAQAAKVVVFGTSNTADGITSEKRAGKLENLRSALEAQPLAASRTGIGLMPNDAARLRMVMVAPGAMRPVISAKWPPCASSSSPWAPFSIKPSSGWPVRGALLPRFQTDSTTNGSCAPPCGCARTQPRRAAGSATNSICAGASGIRKSCGQKVRATNPSAC